MQYLVVIERGPSSYGAYVPDLPGCVAVGESREEVEGLIHEAIEFHIDPQGPAANRLRPGATARDHE
jgi:predicted RNase H-like HicB family nuclease